jgi:hypothetical protein
MGCQEEQVLPFTNFPKKKLKLEFKTGVLRYFHKATANIKTIVVIKHPSRKNDRKKFVNKFCQCQPAS